MKKVLILIATIIILLIGYFLLNYFGVIEYLKLKSNAISVYVGNSYQYNEEFTLSADKEEYIKIENNLVKFVAPGIVIITSTDANNVSSKIMFIITDDPNEIKLNSITLDKPSISVRVNKTEQLTVIFDPSDATYKDISWTSSDPSLASVIDGRVLGIKEGKVTVTATSVRGLTATSEVYILPKEIEVNSIALSNDNVLLEINESKELTVTFDPENATYKDLTWTSSDPSIVTVENGKITGIKEGKAIVMAKSVNGKTASCEVEVGVPVASIKLDTNNLTIVVSESKKLKATIEPSNATNKKVTWSSSDSSVATVNGGKVIGIKVGTAKIGVTSANGKTATCTVTVKPAYDQPITRSAAKGSVFAEYNSETLRYWLETYNGDDYAHVWVRYPIDQSRTGIPSLGKTYSAENLLKHEINTYGYANKGLVAVNGSFFASGKPDCHLTLSQGRVVQDINTRVTSNFGIYGLKADGNWDMWTMSSDTNANQATKNKIINAGVKNTICGTFEVIHRDGSLLGSKPNSSDHTNRTVFCQINKNNFILFSGSGDFYSIGASLKNNYGCTYALNFDGGGSRKLYYKRNDNNVIKKFGGSRAIPDMFYFVEK